MSCNNTKEIKELIGDLERLLSEGYTHIQPSYDGRAIVLHRFKCRGIKPIMTAEFNDCSEWDEDGGA